MLQSAIQQFDPLSLVPRATVLGDSLLEIAKPETEVAVKKSWKRLYSYWLLFCRPFLRLELSK